MIADLKPYRAMKDSGVEWIGDVPQHWEIMPGRSCFMEKKESNVGFVESTVLSLSYGRIVVRPDEKLRGLVPESFETYQIVDPGDIICRPTDLQNDHSSLRFGISKNRGIITSAYMCFRTQKLLERRFGHLLLHAYDTQKIFYGLGSGLRQNLSWEDFKYLPCALPPLPEQAAIVRYLDHVDRQMRRHFRAKQKLIGLLKEQKQALIHRAVTRGLDPDVPFKDSGVQWLGEVPEHWEVRPLKRWVATKITDGPHETPPLLDDGIPFMSAESMVDGRLDFNKRRGFISVELHEVYCKKCKPQRDDIFMCKSGATTGKVALVDTDEDFSIWSPLALVRVDTNEVLPRLFFAILQSDYVQTQVQNSWSYGTQPNLSMGAMERIIIALPSLDEQNEILQLLDHETRTPDLTINRARREIELLREYQIRLTADVVTGKLDIREAAANLPDEPEPLNESNDLIHDPDAMLDGLDVSDMEIGA